MNLLTQQTKELVRRKTEILVHGSEVEQEKEEDHHKNWTLRRMQTRGKCSYFAGSNLTNNNFFQRKKYAFGEIRTYDNEHVLISRVRISLITFFFKKKVCFW